MTVENPLQAEHARLELFTDLYELTMLQAYVAQGMDGEATFSLFVRRLPARRNYLVACGLDDVLRYLETIRFTSESLGYLESIGVFTERFLSWLESFRFTGDVHAIAEGTPVFANEPILEVTAPVAEAQLVETYIMNQVHLQTVLASKAARVVTAARGRPVVDFGPRRMHGIDAAVKAARAFFIAGVDATSNVLAGQIYGVPVRGTMAHSYIQANAEEFAAFEAFVRIYPETVLLVDTYDTLSGVRNVVKLAQKLGDDFKVKAVRLDSGDLAALAKEARRVLDNAELDHVEIFASGSLEEDRIEELLAAEAPIDGFGVGTAMGVSADAPGLDIAYKLCAYGGAGRVKLSSGKPVLPGPKQVFRVEHDGVAVSDVIGTRTETAEGRALLQPVMRAGRRLDAGKVDLGAARQRACEEATRLPSRLRSLESADPPYPVAISPTLQAFHDEVVARTQAQIGRSVPER